MNTPMKPTPPTQPSAATTEKKSALHTFAEIIAKRGKRVMIYGEGGTGKTTLATKINGDTLFVDFEGSIPDLFDENTLPKGIRPISPTSWEQIVKAFVERFDEENNRVILTEKTKRYSTVVFDSLTTLEAIFWSYISTHCRKASEGYGMVNFSDKALPALKDEKELGGGGADSAKYTMWLRFEHILTAIISEGINVVCICHDCEKKRDDAADGADVRHEPRLNDPNSGKNSIRKRAYEFHGEVWCIRWERLRKDDEHTTRTGKRIILGQPDDENAADFDGIMSKSRRGFSKAYLDEFDVNAVLGFRKEA